MAISFIIGKVNTFYLKSITTVASFSLFYYVCPAHPSAWLIKLSTLNFQLSWPFSIMFVLPIRPHGSLNFQP